MARMEYSRYFRANSCHNNFRYVNKPAVIPSVIFGMNHKFSQNIISFIFIFFIWWVLSVILDKPIIPSPIDTIIFTIKHFKDNLYIHILYSTSRILVSIFLSLIIALPTGILMGYFVRIDNILSPFIYFLYPIPKVAFTPVIMLIFGIGDLSKVIIIFIIIYFQIVVSVRDSIKNIQPEMLDYAISAGAGFIDIVRWVLLPASLPGILTSIRISMATSLSVLFFTETFGTEYGLGYLIMDSWIRVNYVEMYSGILTLALLGLLFFAAIGICEKLLCKAK